MTEIATSTLAQQLPNVPYAEQYAGLWAIYEPYGRALRQQAQQINIQLHMERVAEDPEKAAEVAAQASTELNITRDGVAIIKLSGSLMKHASSFSGGTSMVAVRRQVRAAAADPDVTAILLLIDSPGGTVAGTVDLADDVAAAAKKKPVYAYIEDLGASAAYWIASQTTAVYANRSAEVGSIGVFMTVTDWSKWAEKEGAEVHVLRYGDFKGAGIPGTEITEAQLAQWQRSVDHFGGMFVAAVAAGRRLNLAQAKQLADGRVHDAEAAHSLKLIDGIQSLDATLAALVAAGTKSSTKRSETMSEPTTNAVDQPATLADLEAALPTASADFVLGQLKAKATVSQALVAWNAELSKQLDAANAKTEEAEKRAADAEEKVKKGGKQQTEQPGKPFGSRVPAASGDGGEGSEPVDYFEMAKDYQEKHQCRWSEACRAIKKQHPEAMEAFGGPKLT